MFDLETRSFFFFLFAPRMFFVTTVVVYVVVAILLFCGVLSKWVISSATTNKTFFHLSRLVLMFSQTLVASPSLSPSSRLSLSTLFTLCV
jgi:hypothetical protein